MARAVAEERARALALLAEGRTVAAVAEHVGVHRATVTRWKAAGAQEAAAPADALDDALAGRDPTVPPEGVQSTMERGQAPARPRPAKTRRMSVAYYLPVALVARLDAMAEAEGVAVSAVVERLLRQALSD